MMEFGFLSIKHALRFLVKKGNWKLTLIYLEISLLFSDLRVQQE